MFTRPGKGINSRIIPGIHADPGAWWLSPTPLKNDGVKVGWDDDIDIPFHAFPIWWERHNPAMLQTTNQLYIQLYIYIYIYSITRGLITIKSPLRLLTTIGFHTRYVQTRRLFVIQKFVRAPWGMISTLNPHLNNTPRAYGPNDVVKSTWNSPKNPWWHGFWGVSDIGRETD